MAQQIHLTSILDGSKGQLAVDSSCTVTDTLYYTASLNDKLIKPYFSKSVVTFRVNEDAVKYVGLFSDTLSVRIIYLTEDNQLDSTNASLVLNYKPDSVYILRSSFIFSGSHSVTVKVLGLSGDTSLNKVLVLENEMIPYRQYTFDCAVSIPSPLTIVNVTADELTVGWPNVFGTDEADLEWTFIDSSALQHFQRPGNTWDTAGIFENNATRVTLADYSYNIPLLYSGSGSLFVRIRPVQYRGMKRLAGKWSSEYFSNGMLKYDIAGGHEQNLNWQSSISFAEDGKRKAVVQYYDGSLRQRQTVTKDNSTNNTVVAETMYDYQGRPVIQVMPAPTLNTVIQYTKNFNVGLNSAEYDKTKYDLLSSSTGFCDQHAAEMDSTKGASYYYSSNIQPQLTFGIDKYIPQAYNYPFTETEYTADNTGRIKRQSGVGPTFQLGSGHETKYYYAITPDQNELDALFGTEVGDHTHYFKNAVQDANGQVSVSYVDMHGRTIATALSGDSTNSPSMAALDSNIPSTITETIADATTNVTKGVVMESHKSLLVTKTALHTFHYSLNPETLSIKDCNQANICYDCMYDLTITITDDCNNQHLPNGVPYIVKIRNFKLDSIITDCTPHAIDTSFNLQLGIGNYEITKTLSLSEAAQNYQRDSLFKLHNTCKTLDDFMSEQRALLPQGSCSITCSSCLASIGTYNDFKTNYIQKVLGNQDSTAYVTTMHNAYNDALAACNQYCGIATTMSNSMHDALLLDVTPSSGQYANPENIDQYSIFSTNIYDKGLYQTLSGYKNENGKLDTLFNVDGSYKLPQQLFQNDFISNFKPSWAETLLALHPEKCKLDNYESNLDSYNWDARASAVKTYSEAVTAGYADPFNNPQKDPLLSNSTYSGTLSAAYSNYKDVTLTVNDVNITYALSMWDFAKLLVLCPANDSACTANFIVNNQKTLYCAGDSNMAWNNFINLYIRKKTELLNAYYYDMFCSRYGFTESIYAANLLSAGHTLNFTTYALSPGSAALADYNSSDTVYLKNKAQSDMHAAYQNTCNSYKSIWRKQLFPAYAESDTAAIVTQLAAVCVVGSDVDHPLGSRDVSKESAGVIDGSHTYRSFDDVIDTYNSLHSYQKDAKHTADVLTAPLPYYGNLNFDKPAISTPGQTECDKINAYYQQYGVYKSSPSETFSQYLERTTGTKISGDDLSILLSSCAANNTCHFLVHQVSLPPIFQENTGASCIGCTEMDSLYNLYRTAYPDSSYVPKITNQDDTAQQEINDLFAHFMNNRLGFTLNAADYLSFKDLCPLDSSGSITESKDSSHFIIDAPYQVSAGDYRLVFADGIAHIPEFIEQPFNHDNWESLTRFSKTDTLCTGSQFTYETRVKELQSGRGAPLYDLIVGFKSDNVNLELNFVQPVDTISLSSAIEFAGYKLTDQDTSYMETHDSAFARKMIDWTKVRIQAIDNVFRIFVNDTLIKIIPYSGTIHQLTKEYCTFKGTDGYIDYFKVYDLNNTLQYSEEFEDNYQSLSNGPIAFRCPTSSCDSLANAIEGFECYKASLADSVVHKGLCNQKYWTVSGSDDFVSVASSTTNTLEFIKNGTLIWPSYMDTLTVAGASYKPVRNICLNNNITYEFRVKNPIIGCEDGECGHGDVKFSFGNHSINDNQVSVDEDFAFNLANVNGYYGFYDYRHIRHYDSALDNLNFNDWVIIKLVVTDAFFKVYYNGALLLTLNRDGHSIIDQVGSFGIGLAENHGRAIDWIKMSVPVNNEDQTIYFEDFNDSLNTARPDVSHLCPLDDCSTLFTNFYNKLYATNYSYADLSTKYYAACGKRLDVCSSPPTLCNKATASYPPAVFDTITNCTDSTYFITSIAAERYSYYKDSLNNIFDSLYHKKCLQAYNLETFTVTHPVSEYNYTLYYYDQAGNLVQTVPPKAVIPNWNTTYLSNVKTKRAANDTLRPGHTLALATRYLYDALNHVVQQKTPDAGSSSMFYDRLGRLVLSKNAKQATASNYSYTTYDQIGRIAEVGELTNSNTMTTAISKVLASLTSWLADAAATREQITQTVYDRPYDGFDIIISPPLVQRNLRNRVSYMQVFNTADDQDNLMQANGTYFTYDIHGNVDTLVQDYKGTSMEYTQNQFKKIVYTYDLISGKVNSVAYQPNTPDLSDWFTDAFYQRYTYDAENRLTNVETSTDSVYWENEAFYNYYRHGPLGRQVIGQQRVQGIDYAYTLQGWLKGINSTMPGTQYDMGVDGQVALNANNATVARDVFGFALYYYGAGDYHAAAPAVLPFANAGTPLGSAFKPLYNGNIAAMTESISAFTKPLTFNYRYDQLNRLVQMSTYRNNTTTGNDLAPVAVNDFSENIKYDANGNILNYRRYGNSTNANLTNAVVMDSLKYNYYTSTNRLKYIRDNVGPNAFPNDIDNQSNASNYAYDKIGSLTGDIKEGISNIDWTVYGKIKTITKTNGTTINYTYDAAGNRISKIVNGAATGNGETWYVRDAAGNVMTMYTINNPDVNYGDPTISEVPIYGSSRLGMYRPNYDIYYGGPEIKDLNELGPVAYYSNFLRGQKLFELTNHLGNVLATVTDTKIPVTTGNNINYYKANLVNASEYYPGGMTMPGRSYTANSSTYRYGFNGKERDSTITSQDYDYGFRIYDARVVRFLSIDPLTREYPELTPYQFASNRPIDGTDRDGLEWELSTVKHNLQFNNSTQQQMPSSQELKMQVLRQEMMAAAKRPQPQLQPAPVYTPEEQQRHDAITARNLDNAGYNADGTPKPLTKLSENKIWNNFADNIAFPMMTIDGAYGLYKGGASLLLKNIPYGFANAEKFAEFGSAVRAGLNKAGYNDVEPILQGSSVTGKSFSTGQPFDVGRVSDFDVALSSPTLLNRAKQLGIELRSGGTRTGPLMERDLRSLGLYDLSTQLTKQTGREVNFMIYDAPSTATSRAPSISLPPLKK